MIDMLFPVRHKILGMCSGNHENRISRLTSIDIVKDIAKSLGVPYRNEAIYLKVSFGDGNNYTGNRPFVFWSYSTHGYGGARTKGAKAVKVERTAQFVKADVVTMSHDHDVNVSGIVSLHPDNRGNKDSETGFTTGKVIHQKIKTIKTNAYIKWAGYAETGGFAPVDLSTPIVYFLSPQSPVWNDIPETPERAVKVLA